MAILILARHAQASFGTEDYDRLSDLGRIQSRWLGEYFGERQLRFSAVHTGTLKRQCDTASELLASMGHPPLDVVRDAGLNEYHAEPIYRAYAGDADPRQLQNSDYRAYWKTFREAMVAWADGNLPAAPESWAQFGARMNNALATACAGRGRDDVVLVVSSGGAIARALADVLRTPAAVSIEMNLQFRNTAFCELIAANSGLRVISFNNIPHLDRADRRASITAA